MLGIDGGYLIIFDNNFWLILVLTFCDNHFII